MNLGKDVCAHHHLVKGARIFLVDILAVCRQPDVVFVFGLDSFELVVISALLVLSLVFLEKGFFGPFACQLGVLRVPAGLCICRALPGGTKRVNSNSIADHLEQRIIVFSVGVGSDKGLKVMGSLAKGRNK